MDEKTNKLLDNHKLYRYKIFTKFDNRKRSVWLEKNDDKLFESLEELVNYYQNNYISQENQLKLKAGLDKHVVHRNESWFVEKTDDEIINTFKSLKQVGLFFVRPSKGEQMLENGLRHVFTLIFYLNKKNFECQKFAIAKNENSLWIMSQEFSSLIELVHFFKKNVLSNDRTLVEKDDNIQQNTSINGGAKVKKSHFNMKKSELDKSTLGSCKESRFNFELRGSKGTLVCILKNKRLNLFYFFLKLTDTRGISQEGSFPLNEITLGIFFKLIKFQ